MKWISVLLVALASTVFAEGEPQGRVNPFSDPGAATHANQDGGGATGGFVLKAVMPSEQMALANISGEIVALGEAFQGYVLAEVTEYGVRLERGTGVIELELHSDGEHGDE